ncbi:glutamate 5-kinase [Bradyrhizobium sp. CW4]|uniref:glutamate 5-kinase n=1 Tax=Bradyrhizobium sp. CW4 TaxID=2782687 RepID=UPI001FF82331|nr:glutamate 5-kinase [Bradyrhizobium sp. CW4]MCK1412417.1 glutamate 5-kinase [Bradyrhizobium sp. CW4]
MGSEDVRRDTRAAEFEAATRRYDADSNPLLPAPRTLASARRIVVKIGSALIVDQSNGTIREAWLNTLAHDIARLRGRGQDVAVVSSGAVAIGRHALNLHQNPLSKTDRQAAAAVGQIQLSRAYSEIFARHRLRVAQVLLTPDDTTERQHLTDVRATLIKLLSFQTIPVINENDAIARGALSFGDNDRLAARAAQLAGSDMLVLLSNVAGLYSADPYEASGAFLIREVRDVSQEIERMAGAARAGYSSGGMVSKLAAARMALASGCTMIIADGRDAHPLSAIDDGKPCTSFHPSPEARFARKRRIAGTLRSAGTLLVDNAAVIQLRLGESLYVPELKSFDGDFARGDAIVIKEVDGNEVARGLSMYSSAELGCVVRRFELEAGDPWLCGQLKPIVHSDDLALTE